MYWSILVLNTGHWHVRHYRILKLLSLNWPHFQQYFFNLYYFQDCSSDRCWEQVSHPVSVPYAKFHNKSIALMADVINATGGLEPEFGCGTHITCFFLLASFRDSDIGQNTLRPFLQKTRMLLKGFGTPLWLRKLLIQRTRTPTDHIIRRLLEFLCNLSPFIPA